MQGHYDHKGGTPDSYREITTGSAKKCVVRFVVLGGHCDLH
jgi:hypothetical protein